MPRQRNNIRQLNGHHRREPWRDIQSEYRHIRGLTTNGINLRLCLQTEMMSSQLVRKMLTHQITTLLDRPRLI